MKDLAQLAGFMGAHGIWCVEDGQPLIPMLAYIDESGKRVLQRFATGFLEDGAAQARAALKKGVPGARCALTVIDGYIPLEGGKCDALFIEAKVFGEGKVAFSLALPYRNALNEGGFAIHRPKFLTLPDGGAVEEIGGWFFEGVAQHEKGAELWNRCLDESR